MAEVICCTHYTSGSMIIIANLGLFRHLKLMSLNPTGLNKGKSPRKFVAKTLTPKSRQSRTHLVKTNFSLFFLNNL